MKKLFFLCLLLSFCACESEQISSSNDLPPSSGESGEILLFMDSVKWKSPLGDEIRNIFAARQEGILQGELMFKLRWIDPAKINKFLKMHKNMLFVTTFDLQTKGSRKMREFFPKEGIEQIQNNTRLYMLQKQNIYAKGQQVLHLFGKDEATLLKNLRENRKKLRNIFNKIEEERTQNRLFKATQPDLENILKRDYAIKMKIPAGYQVATKEGNKKSAFVWLRFPEAVLDKNLLVCSMPYVSEKVFEPENIMAFRDSLMKKYIYGDPAKPESFVITERLEMPVFDTLQLNGNYTIEMRGLWKTNNISMGGSFVAYLFAKKDRLYYAEGFLYAPNLPKREHLRELTTILKTIE